jgi:hypothetical protein
MVPMLLFAVIKSLPQALPISPVTLHFFFSKETRTNKTNKHHKNTDHIHDAIFKLQDCNLFVVVIDAKNWLIPSSISYPM